MQLRHVFVDIQLLHVLFFHSWSGRLEFNTSVIYVCISMPYIHFRTTLTRDRGAGIHNDHPCKYHASLVTCIAFPVYSIMLFQTFDMYSSFRFQIMSLFAIWTRCQQHVSRTQVQKHVAHCVDSPLLLTTFGKRLGTAKTGCWTFESDTLSHFCLDINCSTV